MWQYRKKNWYYQLWRKEEVYDPNYKQNIQEKEQELSSLPAFEKGAYTEMESKISPKQGEDKQVNIQRKITVCLLSANSKILKKNNQNKLGIKYLGANFPT